MFRTTCPQLAIFILYCLLQTSTLVVLADCDHCWRRGSDCVPSQRPPQYGGPPCTCIATAQPIGCVLKPCSLVETDTLCDCSVSYGSIQNRTKCRKYRCPGDSLQCQSCGELPPNCQTESYSNTPASGGPDCSCANDILPSGCTLKPCYLSGTQSTPCIAIGPTGAITPFGTTCLGNFNLTIHQVTTTDPTTNVVSNEAGALKSLIFTVINLGIVTTAMF